MKKTSHTFAKLASFFLALCVFNTIYLASLLLDDSEGPKDAQKEAPEPEPPRQTAAILKKE